MKYLFVSFLALSSTAAFAQKQSAAIDIDEVPAKPINVFKLDRPEADFTGSYQCKDGPYASLTLSFTQDRAGNVSAYGRGKTVTYTANLIGERNSGNSFERYITRQRVKNLLLETFREKQKGDDRDLYALKPMRVTYAKKLTDLYVKVSGAPNATSNGASHCIKE